MGTVLGDLLQVTARQMYLEQELFNVYYYRVVQLAPADSSVYELFVDQFISTVIDPIRQIQNTLLTYNQIEVRNLSNGLDLYTETVDIDGLISADLTNAAPSYVSAGFKLVRESLATRNGYKRIAGLSEGNIVGNGFNFVAGDQEEIQNGLASDISIGLALFAEPVIVRRPITVPAGTGYTYASIGSAIFSGLGTQNTRKPE